MQSGPHSCRVFWYINARRHLLNGFSTLWILGGYPGNVLVVLDLILASPPLQGMLPYSPSKHAREAHSKEMHSSHRTPQTSTFTGWTSSRRKKNGFFIGIFFGDAIGYGIVSELDWGKHPNMFFFQFRELWCSNCSDKWYDMIWSDLIWYMIWSDVICHMTHDIGIDMYAMEDCPFSSMIYGVYI